MPTVAIITARGGSKRIPRKNIRAFRGIPIIGYSIRAALEAACFDEIMVSTDDAEIADVARGFGAVVPFFRSPQTSDDRATTSEALFEVLTDYVKRERHFEFSCCLYPTAPFITAEMLLGGHRLLANSPDLESVVPVARFGYPVQRALTIQNNRLAMISPEFADIRSQDLPPTYHDIGQFYWFRAAAFLKTRRLVMQNTAPIVVPEWMVHDIDTEEDWIMAETKYEVVQELRSRYPNVTRLPR